MNTLLIFSNMEFQVTARFTVLQFCQLKEFQDDLDSFQKDNLQIHGKYQACS